MSQLAISQCDDPHAFTSLRGEWNSLLERSGSRSVFLRWEWLHGWWRHLGSGSTLLLLLARDAEGTLVGIAPLCVRSAGRGPWSRTVSFLGTTFISSEYLDLVAAPGREAEVAEAIWRALLARSAEWDCIALTDLRDSSVALTHWSRLGDDSRFLVERATCQECPYIELPPTVDEFWKRLTPTMRATVRRRTRKLEETGVRYRIVEEPAEMAATLDLLYELHAKRWATRDQAGKFRDEAVRGFHRELTATMGGGARQRLGTLTHGDRVIGALYWLEYGGIVSFYQMGYQPAPPDPQLNWSYYSPGTVLLGHCMVDAVEGGFTEFDFLRGYEPYKRRWTATWRPTWTLTLIPANRPMTRGLHRLGGWIRASKRRVRRLIPAEEQHG